MTTFPLLEGGGIQLRQLAPADAPALFAHRSNPEVVRYSGVPLYTDIAQAEEYIARVGGQWRSGESYFWAIQVTGEATMAGSICLWNPSPAVDVYDIGYELAPDHWGRGLAGRAARLVARWAFGALGLSAILADPRADNAASVRLLEKLGFTLWQDPVRAEPGHLLYRLTKESLTPQ